MITQIMEATEDKIEKAILKIEKAILKTEPCEDPG
jgi:hypothetical protein